MKEITCLRKSPTVHQNNHNAKKFFLHGEIKNNEPNIRLKYVVNQVI